MQSMSLIFGVLMTHRKLIKFTVWGAGVSRPVLVSCVLESGVTVEA